MLNSIKTILENIIRRTWRPYNPTKKIKKDFRKVIGQLNLEDRFTKIYEINYWGNRESLSGRGSTIELTSNLRKNLPDLFEKFAIRSVFDGPCGDFNWMRLVVQETDIDYTGGDIVLPLIENNQSQYGNSRIRFRKIDLTKDELPNADLMICRDCLFHLSYKDTLDVLRNYVNSKIPYLLTTTYINKNTFSNKDIITGHFRMIDLFSEPYHFPIETLYQIEDWVYPENPRNMCLWSRDQVMEALKRFNF